MHGMHNNIDLNALESQVSKWMWNIALFTPDDGYYWILLMTNPASKVHAIQWNGLEKIIINKSLKMAFNE